MRNWTRDSRSGLHDAERSDKGMSVELDAGARCEGKLLSLNSRAGSTRKGLRAHAVRSSGGSLGRISANATWMMPPASPSATPIRHAMV